MHYSNSPSDKRALSTFHQKLYIQSSFIGRFERQVPRDFELAARRANNSYEVSQFGHHRPVGPVSPTSQTLETADPRHWEKLCYLVDALSPYSKMRSCITHLLRIYILQDRDTLITRAGGAEQLKSGNPHQRIDRVPMPAPKLISLDCLYLVKSEFRESNRVAWTAARY